MSLYALPDYLLERWFAEFEFLPGIRNLAASGAYAATTQEMLALEEAETTDRYLALDLDYVKIQGMNDCDRPLAGSMQLLRPAIFASRRGRAKLSCC
jgi:hypothetical protein